ncbi:amino acid adenylation domain-containing protein [Streptomyces caatingaensis]|uniref:D-alanine--poly(Phosphoribitol) ligase n=1 Tax=Streptomyces caatingaensis TaxID=1678637 RepID=A0A0K9XI93_9ACTN|nr:amino acid adenylation domain-containing protein [Streptomyces caatingaensis]KNB52382.1 hypothetical protein AC230_11435 [Streptomyces caatingaensis]
MQDAPDFLHSGFHASARRHPGRPALELGGRVWTYAELDETVRRWSAALLAAADRPWRIGVLGHRSLVTYAGFLAGLGAGATVVPLNRKYPVARNLDIAERAELDAVLADDASVPGLCDLLARLERTPAVVLPETGEVPADLPREARVLTRADVAATTPLAGPLHPAPDDPAYIIFTSGSTGRPKGVPVAHRNIVHFLRSCAERYRVRPEDRFANTADQTFDLAVFEVFMPWGAGACLVPPDTAGLLSPLDFIRDQRITVWFSVPSAAVLQHRRGLFTPGCLPSLRLSLFGGEALPASVAAAWQEAAPGSAVDNLYGPTEAAVAALAHRWDPALSPTRSVNGVVPIGTPLPGMEAAVLDENGAPVPDGEAGELCLHGPQVFAGYWRAPEPTARAFHFTAPHGGEPRRWYRTGDLCRRTDHGEYVFLGRLDSQVKILGHRIETGEVEAHLLRQKGVEEAVVLAVPGDEEGTSALAAVLSGGRLGPLDVYAVEEGLRDALPPYMIPMTYHLLDALPLNANGKVDRRALRERVVSGELEPVLL